MPIMKFWVIICCLTTIVYGWIPQTGTKRINRSKYSELSMGRVSKIAAGFSAAMLFTTTVIAFPSVSFGAVGEGGLPDGVKAFSKLVK